MRPSYRILRFMSQWIFILYGRGRIFGLRHVPVAGPVLLACNHQSFFDPIIAAMPLRRECHFMARDTLFRNRYFGRLIRHLNAFPVKRGQADIGAIKEALRRLKRGAAVLAFPEATRTSDGRIIPLQSGIVALAKRARCPIVPAVIEGAYEIWPRGQALPGRAPLWVEYGHPIGADRLSKMDQDQAARCLTGRLRTMHNALRERIGRQPLDYRDSWATAAGATAGATALSPARQG